jgi:hypothetical protein
MTPDVKPSTFQHPKSLPHTSFEIDYDRQHNNTSLSPKKNTHKSLLLLSQSRGVQTDDWAGLLTPSPIPPSFGEQLSNSSPLDGQSESSSVHDSNGSHIGIVLDRITTLLARLTQADALTLTNRLKRQNLKGADVGHLSRTTVAGILNETTQLRAQFRAILEDDKLPVTCTRKDLRGLFKLFREFFTEMGQLRITLNDVILDPSIAWKISEMALDPAKAAERERQAAKGYSWIAPLAKLFSSTNAPAEPTPVVGDTTSLARARSRGRNPAPARKAPKLGPALAATTTTVNVEFSGAGVGRAVTNTSSAATVPTRKNGASHAESSTAVPPPARQASFLNIFAGAPTSRPVETWVVLPKDPRRGPLTRLDGETFRRPDPRAAARMSQNVNAVIDSRDPHGPDNDNDGVPPLLQRTLRRRGLSDSSIHSTFMTQVDEAPHLPRNDGMSAAGILPDKGVLQSFSTKVQESFRSATTGVTAQGFTSSPGVRAASRPPVIPEASDADTNTISTPPRLSRAMSPKSLLPNMSTWTTTAAALESGRFDTDAAFFAGSPGNDITHRPWGREAQGREF